MAAHPNGHLGFGWMEMGPGGVWFVDSFAPGQQVQASYKATVYEAEIVAQLPHPPPPPPFSLQSVVSVK